MKTSQQTSTTTAHQPLQHITVYTTDRRRRPNSPRETLRWKKENACEEVGNPCYSPLTRRSHGTICRVPGEPSECQARLQRAGRACRSSPGIGSRSPLHIDPDLPFPSTKGGRGGRGRRGGKKGQGKRGERGGQGRRGRDHSLEHRFSR